MRKLSLQRFAFYCPICGWNSLGEYHGPISHFPAIKKLPNKFAVSVKCPWCGRRRVMAICPKCGFKTPAYKIFKISKRKRLHKLVAKCPRCGFSLTYDYLLQPANIV